MSAKCSPRLETGFATKPLDKISNARTELPTLKELNDIKGMFFRSSVVGDLIGLLPGAGATIASFVSYGIEARFGRRKNQMGTGIAEGIVAPQAAATASVGGAMVHLLALGIPGSGATAVILGAFMLHGIQPGPQVLVSSAPLVYTVFASLFLGLALMCAIGYFAIRPLVKILDFPEAIVSAYVLILCFIGALSIRNNITDLWLIDRLRHIGLRVRKAEISRRAARARRHSRPDRRGSLHEHHDQLLERLDRLFHASHLRDHRRIDHHRPAAAVCAASHQKPPCDGLNRGQVTHAYQSWT